VKQKIIGVFDIGYENVQLVLREGTGGEFHLYPEKTVARIKVGAEQESWKKLVAVLHHEVFEFALTRANCRYLCREDISGDHSAYKFFFDHPTFSEVCAKASEFIVEALPLLEKEWKKWAKK